MRKSSDTELSKGGKCNAVSVNSTVKNTMLSALSLTLCKETKRQWMIHTQTKGDTHIQLLLKLPFLLLAFLLRFELLLRDPFSLQPCFMLSPSATQTWPPLRQHCRQCANMVVIVSTWPPMGQCGRHCANMVAIVSIWPPLRQYGRLKCKNA